MTDQIPTSGPQFPTVHPEHEAAESRAERQRLASDARRGTFQTVVLILVVAISSASLVASLFSTSAARDAKDAAESSKLSSDAALAAAAAAEEAVAGQRLENGDTLCRAQFNAPIVDARAAVDDASSRLLIELTSQATLALAGVDLEPADLQAGVTAVNDLRNRSLVYADVNAQYQHVIAVASSGDREQLDRLCNAGPVLFPPPA